ncbi:MAG: sensor domain-containing diguanylate cyclase [Anaerolineae bacterium]|jgi:diguanylate cyclase (GGDEF)-like protein|nr:sensor domain-containing diguanylate cyclase [Anaerolineae bacterium]
MSTILTLWFIIGALTVLGTVLLILYLHATSRLKKKVERDGVEQLFLDAILKDTMDSIYLKDTESRILLTNDAFWKNVDQGVEKTLGVTDKELFGEEFGGLTMAEEKHIMDSGIPQISAVEVRTLQPGTFYNVLTTKVPVYREGQPVGILGITREFNELAYKHAALTHSATHDNLTDVLNRNAIIANIREALLANNPIAVLFVDMDNFKDINDQFGHPIGDRVLATFAKRMESALRKGDRVGRYGGDEFVIMLSNITAESEAEAAATKLLDALSQPIEIDGHVLVTKISVGITCSVTCLKTDDWSVEYLIRCADHAMYQVKEQGKGGFEFYP